MLLARAQSALGLNEQARKALESLQEIEGQELTVALELAELEARAGDPEAAIRSLEESQLDLQDPANAAAPSTQRSARSRASRNRSTSRSSAAWWASR